MTVLYRQQNDALVWFYAGLLTLVLGVLAISGGLNTSAALPLLTVLTVFSVPVLVMSSLTVSVKDGVVRVWMGPGLMRQQFKVADIVEVSEITAQSPFSVGLRWLGDGWLYSLGGSEFVQIGFRDGRRLLIGTGNQPELAEELGRLSRR